jgi:hypothetical protein
MTESEFDSLEPGDIIKMSEPLSDEESSQLYIVSERGAGTYSILCTCGQECGLLFKASVPRNWDIIYKVSEGIRESERILGS